MRKLKEYLKIICMSLLILSLTACDLGTTSLEAEISKSEEDYELQKELQSLGGQLKINEMRDLLDEKHMNGIKDIAVLQSYAYMEYRLFNEYAKAEDIINKAIELDRKDSKNYYYLGEIYLDSGSYKEAINSFEKAVKNSENYKSDKWDSEMSMAYFSMAKAYLKLNNENKAIKCLENCRIVNPYHMEANALLHRLYVEKEKYERAYEVWKTDNYIVEGKEAILKGIEDFNELYKSALKGKKSHYEMGNLYNKILLYDEAKLEYEKALRKDKGNKDIQSKLYDINIFITFRDELKSYFDDYYRRRCVEGEKAQSNFDLGIYKDLEPIYEKIIVLFPDVKPPSGLYRNGIRKINKKIEEKFNVEIEYINANRAHFGCHFGYKIDDFSTTVSQWSNERDLRLVVLKNMVSNGVWDWLTNGDSKVGGWSNGTEVIVSVLRGNNIGIEITKILDGENRKKELDDAAKYDGDLTDKAPLVLFYSSTLSNQFRMKSLEKEVQIAKEKGITDDKLKNYLINRNFEYFINTTIITHEGQHALDSKYYKKNAWFGENEYRPKMSELSYGDMQFTTLGQLYSTSIGSDAHDSHVRANTQIFQDIVQHIYDNGEKYPEIDTSQNILIQLTKLEEEDIREIAIKIFESKYPDEKHE